MTKLTRSEQIQSDEINRILHNALGSELTEEERTEREKMQKNRKAWKREQSEGL